MTILRHRHPRRAAGPMGLPHPVPMPSRVTSAEPADIPGHPIKITVAVAADRCIGLDLARLQAQLPVDWQVVDAEQLSDQSPSADPAVGLRAADLVVLAGIDPDAVRELRRRSGGAALIAYVPESASAGDVVAVLQAGADGCVRPCEPVLLAAHLRACHRRHPHERATHHWLDEAS